MDKPTCSTYGCERERYCKGMCRRHYDRDRYAADPEAVLSYNRKYRQANRDRVNRMARERRAADGEAIRAADRARYAANPETRRAQSLANFGLTARDYDVLLAAQAGVCAICAAATGARGKSLAVDHDHDCCPERGRSCGQCVRGLLCARCNVGLGMFQDRPELLRAAIAYLAQPPAKESIHESVGRTRA